jgi:hypothetical protein
LSVDAVQLRLIWLELTAAAVKFVGAVGAWVSAAMTLILVEHVEMFVPRVNRRLVVKVPVFA